MKKRIRIAISWVLVSLLFQFVFYFVINQQIEKVMAPPSSAPIVVEYLEAEVPGTKMENIQLSYAKDYIAYKEAGILKVFNLKQKKVVFEKKPPTGADAKHGVIYYQWLPDRDTLVYFYARKNPNPYTNVVVPVIPQASTSNGQTTSPQGADNTAINKKPSTQPTSQYASDSTQKKVTPPVKVKTQNVSTPTTANKPASTAQTQTNTNPSTNPTTTSPANGSVYQGAINGNVAEDPHQAPKPQPAETRIEKRLNNPQLTELFSLELPPGDEKELAPDDRFNRSIESFPAGGTITQMVVSTFTNLMYLTVKTDNATQLMEIDIMKNVRILSKAGEQISHISASDKFGTLFLKSRIAKTEQILALQGLEREAITKDPEDVILGNRNGTIYLGKVTGGQLTNIRSSPDTDSKKMKFKTIWEGSIPYKNNKGVIVGVNGEVIVYDNQTAFVVQNGKENKISLPGSENLISLDGVELIQISRNATSTKIKLQPLNQ